MLKWIWSYLSNRAFFFKFDSAISSLYPVTSGVPQGDVLSPLLFIICTREIPSVLSVSTRVEAVAYADDIKVYGTYCEAEKNIVTNASKISLQKLLAWASLNGIHVNLSKSSCMTISKKIPDRSSLVDYFHSGLSLPRPTAIRDLGFLVNPRLGFADYIEVMQRKALQKIDLLFRNVRHANKDVYLKLYKAYIVPQLEYARQGQDQLASGTGLCAEVCRLGCAFPA
ncbi:hypothetical protein Y032_0074g858 [Ancylostoma ceylanicum]|uniref:Reverse transcriptase domain-containing protein n=1 Tax=Ancylostoma ceylanicum TaxID=53326 RepID=A0A016TV94_9BILA|nr:hypothetical protein Y032_0074g858 [Ancylostoma ceylanicum]